VKVKIKPDNIEKIQVEEEKQSEETKIDKD